jgi:hypothetical protein
MLLQQRDNSRTREAEPIAQTCNLPEQHSEKSSKSVKVHLKILALMFGSYT